MDFGKVDREHGTELQCRGERIESTKGWARLCQIELPKNRVKERRNNKLDNLISRVFIVANAFHVYTQSADSYISISPPTSISMQNQSAFVNQVSKLTCLVI